VRKLRLRGAQIAVRAAGWTAVALVASILLGVVLAAFGPLPSWVVNRSPAAAGFTPADRWKAESDIRASALQAVAGVLLVIGAVIAWRQMLIARKQQQVGRRTAVTEAFTKAVAQLGDADSLALRLGGIYSLDRVVNDDYSEARRVAEILSAFVRDRAQSAPVGKDVVAAVRVLASREWPLSVDFTGSILAGIDLSFAKLLRARLESVDLGGANLQSTVMRGADFRKANLRGAQLRGADFRETQFDQASLSGAIADTATRWPTGFVPADHGVRFG
jgi:Pentapeptide repeats (8 copies)